MTAGFEIALTLVMAFLVTAAMMPLAKAASVRFGIVALPSSDRPHSRPTALLGGLAVMAGLVAAIGFVGILSGLPHHSIPWLAGFAVAMCMVGLLDDIVDLQPRHKFMLELAAICMLVWWGPHLDFFPYQPVNIALTIFWLIAATNAFNLIDGVDGLAAGVGIVAALSIAIVAGLHQHNGTMVVALALAGALAGFMIFNFPPASVFMGDEGALAVGLVLGVLSIQGSRWGEGSLPARLAMPLLALMVPLLDMVTVTVTRLATGNPISKRGLDHSHHRLTRLGMTAWSAAATLIGLQVIAGGCAIALSLVPGYDAVLLIPYMVLFFALVALFLMDRSFDGEALGQIEDLPAIARVILSFGYKRRFVELILDVALVAAAYFGAMMLRFDFNLSIAQVSQMLAGLPWIVALGCAAFLVAGVYRGIWRYTGLAEGVRFVLAAMIAGLAVKLASAFLPITISRATAVMFVLLLFNFLVATRWSFHVFQRIGRFLAHSARRLVIVGADARGAAAVQHLHSTVGASAELLGVLDDDSFKHGKLFHGYPVLGSLDDLDGIMARTPFDEIVIAQETLSDAQLAALERFAESHQITLRRFWLGVTDMSASPTISDRQLTTA
jgi:UDP-GlcNAc:undecaprenyl-phosphate/decaprenyl-phosphate GlcNAc-1-phosphate transferase